jgi:penicillin-binding protein 1A
MARKPKNSRPVNWIKRLWLAYFIGLGVFILFIATVKWGLWGELPPIEELENPETKLATEIYAEDGSLLGKFFASEDRTNIRYEDIPEEMVNALVATEDARFYKHSGIDYRALARAIVKLGTDGGGSTISQQLAKNLFHGYERPNTDIERILQKFKEWVIAVELEKRYTKSEIITMYFNTVPWGNSYGIKSAAKRYFNKSTDELNIQECAVLVGMLQAPTRYNPVNATERSTIRRNVVLNQMEKYGYLEEAKCDSLKALPLITDYKFVDHNTGPATYFRDYLQGWMKNWCLRNGYNLYDDGLRIYTTIHADMQKYAEEAVQKHLTQLQKDFYSESRRLKKEPWRDEELKWKVDKTYIPRRIRATPAYKSLVRKYGRGSDSVEYYLNQKKHMKVFSWNGDIDTLFNSYDSLKHYKQIFQTGFMAMEPQSGYIRAWVGGIDHKYFKYDHVNKNSGRQVGSTFKPFVYTRALDDEKIEPCEVVPTGPVTVDYAEDKTWSPKNSGKVEEPYMDLYTGLKKSVNTVTARVMKRMGPNAAVVVKQTAEKMGINGDRFEPYPTIALGVMDISVYEMVGAYGTFPNNGEYVEPIFVLRIEDKHGNVIEDFTPKREEVLRAQTAYIMCRMLEKVTSPGGTGARLRYRYGLPSNIAIGGKTGTTQNNSDGWFMGVTPDLVAGCWVGCEDRQVHFLSTAYGQGANMALPIYGMFMKKVYDDPNITIRREWEKPDVEFTIELDCTKYKGKSDGPTGIGDDDIPGI